MKFNFALAITVTSIASTAHSAVQPEQTPDNAQKFLERVFEDHQPGLLFSPTPESNYPKLRFNWCQSKYVRGKPGKLQEKCGEVAIPEYVMKTEGYSIGSDACKSKILVSINKLGTHASGSGAAGDGGDYALVSVVDSREDVVGPLEPFEIAIDWSSVKAIAPTDRNGIAIYSADFEAKFYFIEDMAVRVMYAATFLKDECDRTSGFGF